MADNSPWNEEILAAMQPGAVTFTWDNKQIRTVPAPPGTFKTMQSAWEWIDERVKEFGREGERPRSICFRLEDGTFRGLRFPDLKPGALDDSDFA